ncbi:MAG: LolA family protein [Pyrinomonadaceae bacterium]
MKAINRIFFIGILFSTLSITANAQLDDILRRMESHAKALSSLKSNITMTKHDTTLDVYDTQNGSVNYLPGNGKNVYLRVDWVTPAPETLIVANGEYVLYRPKLKQAIVGKTSDAEKKQRENNALAFMTMSRAELKRNYQIQYLGVEKIDGVDMWRLRLNPKVAAGFKYAELWADGNGMPIQSMIVEKNNDTTTILLSDIQKNVTLQGSIFKPKLPKGTKIIKG